ncbi:MAG: hypothetical protein WCJ13_11350 [Coriobacteriia bacterium]
MKRCAKCDYEYDDAYDGCPVCARTPQTKELPSGSLGGAALSVLGYILLAGFFSGVFIGAGQTQIGTGLGSITAVVTLALIVSIDANGIIKPVESKPKGILGTPAMAWAAGSLLLAVIFVPTYFYQRPRIKAVYGSHDQ